MRFKKFKHTVIKTSLKLCNCAFFFGHDKVIPHLKMVNSDVLSVFDSYCTFCICLENTPQSLR